MKITLILFSYTSRGYVYTLVLSERREQMKTENESQHDGTNCVCMLRALQPVARGRIDAAI